jgi:hypothetical protein
VIEDVSVYGVATFDSTTPNAGRWYSIRHTMMDYAPRSGAATQSAIGATCYPASNVTVPLLWPPFPAIEPVEVPNRFSTSRLGESGRAFLFLGRGVVIDTSS